MNAERGTLHLVPVPISPATQWNAVSRLESAAETRAEANGAGEAAGGADTPGAARACLPPATLAAARAARYFLAENARTARAFLKAIGHPQPIATLQIIEIGHAPDPGQVDAWLDPLAPSGDIPAIDAVVLAEAGCPGIADPGASVVARAHARGIVVVPWVGPSSILLALMGAGMNGQAFRFLGYLPQDRAALQERLLALQRDALQGETQVFIETPYRNERLLQTLLEVCDGTLQLCVAVDLTGAGQAIATRSITQWRALGPEQRPSLDRRAAAFLLCVAPHAGPGAMPRGRSAPPARPRR